MSKNKGNILLPLLAGALVVSLAAAGFFFWQNQQYQGEALGPYTPASTPTPAPTPQDETANWKTYASEKYGISFKYPQRWGKYSPTIKESDELLIFLRSGAGLPTSADLVLTVIPGSSIAREIAKENNALPEIRQDYPSFYLTDPTKTTIDNKEGTQYYAMHPEEFDFGSDRQLITLFENNGKLYKFTLDSYAEDPAPNLFSQILSTFKFL